MKTLVITAMFVLLAAHSATVTEFHVVPTGNDANPSTAAKPFANITKARGAGGADSRGTIDRLMKEK